MQCMRDVGYSEIPEFMAYVTEATTLLVAMLQALELCDNVLPRHS